MPSPGYGHEGLSLGCKVVFVPTSFALVQQPSHVLLVCLKAVTLSTGAAHWMIPRGGWEGELYSDAVGIQTKKLIPTEKVKEGRKAILRNVVVTLPCFH